MGFKLEVARSLPAGLALCHPLSFRNSELQTVNAVVAKLY